MDTRIAVVGAGAVGLSTAVQLQSQFPSTLVTIIADKFTTQTTSHGAAGIFNPSLRKTSGVPVHVLKNWLHDSWNYYDALAHSGDAGEAGVQITSGFQFYSPAEPRNEVLASCAYEHRPMTEKQLRMFNNVKYTTGWFVTTMVVDPARYLPYLMNKFVKNGGRIVEKKLSSLQELVGQYDMVINCAGLGSRELIGDLSIYANRGHLVSVRAPWVKHFVYTGEEGLQYIIPGVDMVHIGGTRTDYDTDITPRPADTERILNDAYRVIPSLKGAPIVREWVGLRPKRPSLRIEQETVEFPTGNLKVVHNYGHGAEGISLSWGTSTYAVQLAKELLSSTPSSASKL